MRLRFLIFLCSIFLPFLSQAYAETKVLGTRAHDTGNTSRFVLELSQDTSYKLLTLSSPPRIVIDLNKTSWPKSISPPTTTKHIKKVRHSPFNPSTLRVVLDMNSPTEIHKHFTLTKDKKTPHRLVLDLTTSTASSAPPKPKTTKAPKSQPTSITPIARPKATLAPVPQFKAPPEQILAPTIIIDPGHGGKDPGAIGRRRTKEKYLTLSYAMALKKALQKTNRYKVYTTRQRDIFVSLNRRVEIAQQRRGDLFISLHADSHKNRRIRGTSIYTLSEKASDKEAAALAKKENLASFVAKLSPRSGHDVDILLIDLVQRDTKNLSSYFAETLAYTFKGKVRTLSKPHRFAGFRVLTAPDIPSILIELGYLSNRQEEKLLLSSKHKKKLVNLFVRAIDTHFRKYPVKQ